MLSQKEMKIKLSPEAKELLRIIKGIVKSGNCLVDDGSETKLIKDVELGADSTGKIKAFVFRT